MVFPEEKTQTSGIESRSKPPFIQGTNFLTKEVKIYNGERKASSINGAGKTGKPPAKE